MGSDTESSAISYRKGRWTYDDSFPVHLTASHQRSRDILMPILELMVSNDVLRQHVTFDIHDPTPAKPSKMYMSTKIPERKYLYLPIYGPFGMLFGDCKIDVSSAHAADILRKVAKDIRCRRGLQAFRDAVGRSILPGGRMYRSAQERFEAAQSVEV